MVTVIAECGVNWRNLAEADIMIKECAEAGADIVKFQAYHPSFTSSQDMYDTYLHLRPLILHPRAEELNNIALKEEDVRYLYWRCCQHKIELMITPFYPECISWINPYVKRWKIREKDHLNGFIIDKCLKTGKEVLISSQQLMSWNYNPCRQKIYQLYCIPEYPPKKGHDIINNFKGFDGASCHYPCIDIALDFVKLGTKYLEVHVKRDCYLDNYCTIDNAVSITMSELAELVDTIRSWE